MKTVPETLLRTLADRLSKEDRDEMALPSYLHRNPALRWMAYRRLHAVSERLATLMQGRKAPRHVLDFGCGSGILLPEILGVADQVYGVDLVLLAAQVLVQELKLDRVTLMQPHEMTELVPAASIDVVIAAEVLEHVESVTETMNAFKRVLKPGGRLLVSLPTENALYRFGRRLAGFSGHYHHANAASIDTEIRAAGFRRHWREQIPAPGPLCIYWVAEYEAG